MYARKTGIAVRQYLTCSGRAFERQHVEAAGQRARAQIGEARATDRLGARVEFHRAFQARGELEDEGELLEQASHAIEFLDSDAAVGEIFVDPRR